MEYSAGEFGFSGNGIQRWSQTGINTNPTEFGEYNTHLADGTVLTPASNIVTFNKGSEVQMETVLSAERAAELTMEYTLGEWAATAAADATQAVVETPFGISTLPAVVPCGSKSCKNGGHSLDG